MPAARRLPPRPRAAVLPRCRPPLGPGAGPPPSGAATVGRPPWPGSGGGPPAPRTAAAQPARSHGSPVATEVKGAARHRRRAAGTGANALRRRSSSSRRNGSPKRQRSRNPQHPPSSRKTVAATSPTPYCSKCARQAEPPAAGPTRRPGGHRSGRQRGPPVLEVLQPDQARQVLHARHHGVRRAADARLGIGEQPDVRVEADHRRQDVKHLLRKARWSVARSQAVSTREATDTANNLSPAAAPQPRASGMRPMTDGPLASEIPTPWRSPCTPCTSSTPSPTSQRGAPRSTASTASGKAGVRAHRIERPADDDLRPPGARLRRRGAAEGFSRSSAGRLVEPCASPALDGNPTTRILRRCD